MVPESIRRAIIIISRDYGVDPPTFLMYKMKTRVTNVIVNNATCSRYSEFCKYIILHIFPLVRIVSVVFFVACYLFRVLLAHINRPYFKLLYNIQCIYSCVYFKNAYRQTSLKPVNKINE